MKEQAKFTPGPWKIEWPLPDQHHEGPIILGSGGQVVAEILGPLDDEDGLDRGTFDARLIAAAPALYEACRDVYQIGLTTQIRIKVLAALVLAEKGGA